METAYKGNIEVKGTIYPFLFSDYRLVISTGNDKISWSDLRELMDEGVLILTDTFGSELTLFAEKFELIHLGEYAIHVLGYIARYDPDGYDTKSPVKSLLFKHPVIDYFFRRDQQIIERYIGVLNSLKEDGESDVSPKRQEYQITINDKDYTLQFDAISYYLPGERHPFLIYNCILVKSEDNISDSEILRIVGIVKTFLRFISHTRDIDLEPVLINYYGNNLHSKPYDAALKLKSVGEGVFAPESVIPYECLQKGIANIFTQIARSQINFRNLFDSSKTEICMNDIVNACAAFEAQFDLAYSKKFSFPEQKAVKEKMIANLTALRNTYMDTELEHFDSLLAGFNNVKEFLKKRLEIALADLVNIYGERETESKFREGYQEMPERIKNARNWIAHGDHTKPLESAAFFDVRLVRAITYMLILKEAKLTDSDIKSCIREI